MKNISKSALMMAAVVAIAAVGFAGSAKADPRHGEWDHHERDVHHWHHHYGPAPVGVVYAPPTAVYVPPEPSPGISLILPIHIH